MAELSTLGAVIKTAYEAETNTNAFTDAEKTKLANTSAVAMSGSFMDLTNVPNFVELDNSGTVPMQYLNVSSLSFKGAWDAATNTPSLVDGTGSIGDFYKVSVGGTHNFGNGDYLFAVGDWVMFAAGVWQRIGVHESVTSVNGKIGNVALSATDVGAKPSSYTPTYEEITGKPNFAALYQPKQRGTIGHPIPAGLFNKTANQSIDRNSLIQVTWQNSIYDQFSIRSGNNFIIPTWAKYVRVTGSLQWGGQADSTDSPLYAQVQVNSTQVPAGGGQSRVFGNINIISNSFVSGIIPVKSGDIIRVMCYQNTGATRNIETGASNQSTWIQIELFE